MTAGLSLLGLASTLSITAVLAKDNASAPSPGDTVGYEGVLGLQSSELAPLGLAACG